MKTFPLFLAAATLQLFSILSTAQTAPAMSLVTTINPQGATHLIFRPDGEMEVSYWDNEYIKVEISIDDPSFKRRQLKALVPMGIYRIEAVAYQDIVSVSAPGQHKDVTINGKQVASSMKFHLTLPRYTTIERPGTDLIAGK